MENNKQFMALAYDIFRFSRSTKSTYGLSNITADSKDSEYYFCSRWPNFINSNSFGSKLNQSF